MALGSALYAQTPWSFPAADEHAALGIRGATFDDPGGAVDCGYPVRLAADFDRALEAAIDEFRPDILWTQLEGAAPLLARARERGVQGLYFVHDAETPEAELRAIAETGCHLVASSGFLARKARRAARRPVQTVYPCPELHAETRGSADGCITMINPHRVKGLQTLLALAARLPKQPFLLLESWKLTEIALAELGRSLKDLPNVRLMRRVADMRPVYAQTKLLLVPSVWEEGFGMVAVEAQSCGIPVIASARGGLPESVGTGGVLVEDYLNTGAWARAIAGVLADRSRYAELSQRALRHSRSRQFTVAESARRLLATCSAPPPPRGGLFSRGVRAAASLARLPALGSALRQRGRERS
jgi:glycosyltransferase involved in cell wall biosynthesis